jgi:HEAT repeat protein
MDLKDFLEIAPWDWPKDAGKTFQNALTNKSVKESDRLIAAELAGDLVVLNDRLADALMAVVGDSDESEKLRATAAIAMGPVLEQSDTDGFDDPEDIPISERTFRNIQDLFRNLYADDTVPKEVRRRILEASVRATEDWQKEAIADAYSTGDREWMLTAVFCMAYVRGFDDQILEALRSTDPEIHYQAVIASGNWELDASWPHIVTLLDDERTEKPLRIAAIGAIGSIRPLEAREILVDLSDSEDEEIAEAAEEALLMSRTDFEEDDEEAEEDEGEWIN